MGKTKVLTMENTSYFTKELLIYVAFTVDALNTFISFPLFVLNGPKWFLSAMPKKEKDEDQINLADTDRRSFKCLWELFMVCYEGYFGFTASTLICIYKVPETIPIFAYSLFALYIYKCKAFLRTFDGDERAKLYWICFFFIPCYGGYCLLHSLEYFRGE